MCELLKPYHSSNFISIVNFQDKSMLSNKVDIDQQLSNYLSKCSLCAVLQPEVEMLTKQYFSEYYEWSWEISVSVRELARERLQLHKSQKCLKPETRLWYNN